MKTFERSGWFDLMNLLVFFQMFLNNSIGIVWISQFCFGIVCLFCSSQIWNCWYMIYLKLICENMVWHSFGMRNVYVATCTRMISHFNSWLLFWSITNQHHWMNEWLVLLMTDEYRHMLGTQTMTLSHSLKQSVDRMRFPSSKVLKYWKFWFRKVWMFYFAFLKCFRWMIGW